MKKKKTKRFIRRRVISLVVALVLVLSCSPFVYADTTVDHSEPDTGEYSVDWVNTTNTYTPEFESKSARRYLIGYSSDSDPYKINTASSPDQIINYYGDLYLWYEIEYNATYKYNHDPLGYAHQILSIGSRVQVSPAVTGASVISFECVDVEVSGTPNITYASKVNGYTNSVCNFQTYILGETRFKNYQTERYNVKAILRCCVKVDITGSNSVSITPNADTYIEELTTYIGDGAISTPTSTETISSYSSYETADDLDGVSNYVCDKLYELNQCTDDIYHELYSLHTRIISMHTTLSEILTVMSNFATSTGMSLRTIITLLQDDKLYNGNIYELLLRNMEQYSYSQYAEMSGEIAEHESREDVALSMIESYAPDVEDEIATLKAMDFSAFWEENAKGANFWKTLLNKFFDVQALGVIASFMSLIVIILLIKFVLRL